MLLSWRQLESIYGKLNVSGRPNLRGRDTTSFEVSRKQTRKKEKWVENWNSNCAAELIFVDLTSVSSLHVL